MAQSTSNIFSTSGIQLPKDACVVIVRTAWNAEVVDKLEEGCIKILEANKVAFKVVTVPGAFELTFAVKHYFENALLSSSLPRPAAFIALGCVLRGGTPHFDYVCKAVTDGVVQLNLDLPIPTIFGILTVDNITQAEERLGGAHGHKGEEAASTALQMAAWSYSLKNKQ